MTELINKSEAIKFINQTFFPNHKEGKKPFGYSSFNKMAIPFYEIGGRMFYRKEDIVAKFNERKDISCVKRVVTTHRGEGARAHTTITTSRLKGSASSRPDHSN